MSQVRTCIAIALRCVAEDRYERPEIKDIITKLEELEPKIDKMSLYPDQSQDLIDLQVRMICSFWRHAWLLFVYYQQHIYYFPRKLIKDKRKCVCVCVVGEEGLTFKMKRHLNK